MCRKLKTIHGKHYLVSSGFIKISGFPFPVISFCSTISNKSCRQWGTHCWEPSPTFSPETGMQLQAQEVWHLLPKSAWMEQLWTGLKGHLEFSVTQRSSHTGAGLEQLLTVPHINIMIRINIFSIKVLQDCGISFAYPWWSHYTLFYLPFSICP